MSKCNFVDVGNLTADPDELRQVGDSQVVRFRVAFNSRRGKKEETVYMDCEAWGGLAQTISTYCKKGQKIHLTGLIRQDEWVDKQTEAKRSKLFLSVNSMDFVSGPAKTEEQDCEIPF